MIVKLLTGHHLEFLSLKGGCRGSSESTHVKMPHCRTSNALAQLCWCLRFDSILFRNHFAWPGFFFNLALVINMLHTR